MVAREAAGRNKSKKEKKEEKKRKKTYRYREGGHGSERGRGEKQI